jgi:hypothetical protein
VLIKKSQLALLAIAIIALFLTNKEVSGRDVVLRDVKVTIIFGLGGEHQPWLGHFKHIECIHRLSIKEH